MSGRIEKTVFISYRRTNLPWALAIYQELTHRGYDVFFDYLSIPSGDFEDIIIENIKGRTHFVVILTPSALERCNEPGDWLRREIETAMNEKRNIVPLMLESFDFGSPSTAAALTGKLEGLKKYNGLRLHSEYFFEGMNRLREQYLNVSLDAVVHPISENTIPITEEHQMAASEAAPVEKEQLTAQEWSERAYVHFESDNLDEAIRCYTKAIELDPTDVYSYGIRGMVHLAKGDLDNAMVDLEDAIRLGPDSSSVFAGRGLVREARGESAGAIQDFDEAVRIEPDFYQAYKYRGDVFLEMGNLKNAFKDYNESIRLKPDYADAYYKRGKAWEKKRKFSSAILDYQKYLELGSGKEGDQKEIKKKIMQLKRLLTKRKSARKKTK